MRPSKSNTSSFLRMSQPKRAKLKNDLRGAILNVEHMHTGAGDIIVIEESSS